MFAVSLNYNLHIFIDYFSCFLHLQTCWHNND